MRPTFVAPIALSLAVALTTAAESAGPIPPKVRDR